MEEVIVSEDVWEELDDGTRRLVIGAGAVVTEDEAKKLGAKSKAPAEDKAVKEPPEDKAVTSKPSSSSRKK